MNHVVIKKKNLYLIGLFVFFLAEKTVLIVYAHQSLKSFNCAVKDTAVKALTDQGCKVIVSDLYAMKFRAAATTDDVKGQETFNFNNGSVVLVQGLNQ